MQPLHARLWQGLGPALGASGSGLRDSPSLVHVAQGILQEAAPPGPARGSPPRSRSARRWAPAPAPWAAPLADVAQVGPQTHTRSEGLMSSGWPAPRSTVVPAAGSSVLTPVFSPYCPGLSLNSIAWLTVPLKCVLELMSKTEPLVSPTASRNLPNPHLHLHLSKWHLTTCFETSFFFF